MICTLLCWWDEDPAWLTRAVVGVRPFTDHLIAVDGAYESIEGSYDHPRSPGPQVDAIVAAADGMGLTLFQPVQPWVGDRGDQHLMLGRQQRQHPHQPLVQRRRVEVRHEHH